MNALTNHIESNLQRAAILIFVMTILAAPALQAKAEKFSIPLSEDLRANRYDNMNVALEGPRYFRVDKEDNIYVSQAQTSKVLVRSKTKEVYFIQPTFDVSLENAWMAVDPKGEGVVFWKKGGKTLKPGIDLVGKI